MKFSRATAVASLAALFAGVQAQTPGLTITNPGGSDLWWVANSINVLAWTCQTSPYQNYTVILANQDPTKWASLAILAVEQNFDCSKEITAQQVTAPPGTGYLIELTSTLNETDIYATSQPFEIKATGAAYPVTTSASSPSSTASASGAANSSSSAPASGSTGQSSGKSNGASKTSAAVIFAAAAAALGLFLA